MSSSNIQNGNYKLYLTYSFSEEKDVFNFLTNMNKNNMSFPNEFTLKNFTNINHNINQNQNRNQNQSSSKNKVQDSESETESDTDTESIDLLQNTNNRVNNKPINNGLKKKINFSKRKRNDNDNSDASSIVSFTSDSESDDDTVCISKDTNSSKNKKMCKKRKRETTTWNQFLAENAGKGWNKKEMSYRYNQLYNN